ncbi:MULTISPECIES: xanthine dehydrogenase family protein molybdopterin-binding subunit [Bacillota]|uniref:Molybdopterin-dependent oxidoreductase n=2 Tax=Amedibacillus TaxID=2749846 RepID=A0A7G9GM16_9FIRM|nr:MULTISPECIES: molybdopterin cofactor-binding domain-containing protein [Bacillota]QNM11848.1 molybdopterin-dependent oxidoreductase [[Eubacterium] hominis]MCH4287229.1 molybdopterin-dependent oxidoreductase [Amedibacillus hominis]RGB50642.1 aldehyde oxidase [Absiella sp. AM22-9]RGB62919.1 aldehyde oxidase [Absiella sp. AM10-20]RGB64844.1 aldehyde oxidase [Absiella sp. AM09-45]
MKYVNQPIVKKDAYALLSGKPVYCDDLALKDCLIIKLLRSPHAHAKIKSIDTTLAEKVPGIEAVYTYKDVPQERFTLAGQTFPEPSPYDRQILEDVVRYVGDEVAIVAGKDEACVNKALKLIKVEYEVLDAVLDFTKAIDNEVIVHPEDNYKTLCEIGNERMRNICSHDESVVGDLDAAFDQCDIILERDYHTKANAQAMMETFRSYAYVDAFDRLNVVSSTQVPFHVRRMLSNALGIPKTKIRVVKPRIGGGFGAKQTGCCEIFAAFVTWKLKKPSKIVYTREETFTASNSRHEMKMHVKIGAKQNGEILAIDLHTLSNTGAYGEHGSTTVGLSGHKSLPIYNHMLASRFHFDVVYTNTMQAGAYRGYGATQGQFAVESAVNELAEALHLDPCELRFMNMVKEGEVMPQYYGEQLNACALDRCLKKAMDMIGWKEKGIVRDMGDKMRGLGVALSMQGSGIANVDIASVIIKLQDDGFYTLAIGATDMGTGCDTILAQMAAECLECDVDQIVTQGVDTDASPYDTGSYASATTYVTGMSVVKACEVLKKQIIEEAAVLMEVEKEHISFDGKKIYAIEDGKEMSLSDFANICFAGGKGACLIANASHCSPTSPPPFMAGIAEVDVDKLTGEITMVDYVAVVDSGTIINPNLARIQVEGGIAQGIGMALYEDVTYSDTGKMRNNSFMQYKIPTRLDVGRIRVDFESSYEDSGPFGAKSIGEVVINTPSPAIASAVAHASGMHVRTLPITAEKVLLKQDED